MDAVLRLDEGYLRLAVAGHSPDVLRWPLVNLHVETTPDGDYLLHTDGESFTFAPQVDDGLGHEIALRTKFASNGNHEARPTQTVAERVKSEPLHRRRGVLTGADLGVRTATIIMAILALIVVAVAAFSGRLQSPSNTESPVPSDTLPFTESSPTLEAPVEATSAAGEQSPVTATTAPPTPTTIATTPPSTAAPATSPTTPQVGSVFGLTPAAAVEQWDALATDLGTGMLADSVSVDTDAFAFRVGDFIEMSGTAGRDGTVSVVEFRGDPGGTVADDRQVLSGLGLAVALVDPSLPPAMRREVLDAMGFDVDSPELEGLDGSLEYQGVSYAIRWDTEDGRLVFIATR